MPYALVQPVVDLSVRQLCTSPYYNHPEGCPNYGRKKGCPPTCRTIGQLMDLKKPVYAIWNAFDFAGHCSRMREAHPTWSKRQIGCCLYWQPKARKQLCSKIFQFLSENDGHFIITNFIISNTPEAAGVNMTATMKAIGINLEWPPKVFAYQIVLAGKPKPV